MGEVVIYDGRGNKFPSNFNLRRLLVFHFSLGLVILRNQLLIGSSSEEMQQRSKYQLFPYIHIYVSFFFFQPLPTLIPSALQFKTSAQLLLRERLRANSLLYLTRYK